MRRELHVRFWEGAEVRFPRATESAKSECLERIVLLGEQHLRAAVRAFMHHYNYVSYCPTSLCA
jgi:hypothetical protein